MLTFTTDLPPLKSKGNFCRRTLSQNSVAKLRVSRTFFCDGVRPQRADSGRSAACRKCASTGRHKVDCGDLLYGHHGRRARWAHASKQATPLCRKQALVIIPKSTRLCRRVSQISGDAVLSYRHQVSVAPTNLKPVKSDFTNGMSRRVESDRAKHEVQVSRVILFKDYRRQSLQLHAAFHHPNRIRAESNCFLGSFFEGDGGRARNRFLTI